MPPRSRPGGYPAQQGRPAHKLRRARVVSSFSFNAAASDMEAEDASLTLSRDKPMDTARVTALVMQWLHENNYLNALRALEADR
jgi:hypothetical protein